MDYQEMCRLRDELALRLQAMGEAIRLAEQVAANPNAHHLQMNDEPSHTGESSEDVGRRLGQRQWTEAERKRWGVYLDREELYLRRVSEMQLHDLLDAAGVPAGNRSLSSRVNGLLELVGFPHLPPPVAAPTGQEHGEESPPATAEDVPPGPWKVASSGVSLDAGPIRMRTEGGSREQRRAFAAWVASTAPPAR